MRRAILFGQNAVDPQAYQGWGGELTGCVPDARDLAALLAKSDFEAEARFSGWQVEGPGTWPWTLTLQCTRAAWREAHVSLQAAARAGDTIVFGNSGHGGRYALCETLCFADGQLTDGELRELIAGWRPGVRVLYVIDTCHSGGMDRDGVGFRIRSAPRWALGPSPAPANRNGRSEIRADVVEFCACRADETAADGPFNGAWTGALLAAWSQRRGHLTWREWFATAAAALAVPFPRQHPALNLVGGDGAWLEEAFA